MQQGQAFVNPQNITLRDPSSLRRSVYTLSLCRRDQLKFPKREKISLLGAVCNADGHRELVVQVSCQEEVGIVPVDTPERESLTVRCKAPQQRAFLLPSVLVSSVIISQCQTHRLLRRLQVSSSHQHTQACKSSGTHKVRFRNSQAGWASSGNSTAPSAPRY